MSNQPLAPASIDKPTGRDSQSLFFGALFVIYALFEAACVYAVMEERAHPHSGAWMSIEFLAILAAGFPWNYLVLRSGRSDMVNPGSFVTISIAGAVLNLWALGALAKWRIFTPWRLPWSKLAALGPLIGSARRACLERNLAEPGSLAKTDLRAACIACAASAIVPAATGPSIQFFFASYLHGLLLVGLVALPSYLFLQRAGLVSVCAAILIGTITGAAIPVLMSGVTNVGLWLPAMPIAAAGGAGTGLLFGYVWRSVTKAAHES